MNTNRRTLLTSATVLAGTGLLGAGTVIGAYSSSIAVANRRVAQNSNLIPTTCGNLEYAMAGKGRPFLMIHGTGGGFDQGLRFAQGLVERGMQVIAPSRFGYLRSSFPDDPSPERQADCLNELLDHLGIDTLPVAGGSAGALIAAQFALHYPQRCSHLILLVPAANLTQRDPVEFTAFQQALVRRLLTSDFCFWAATQLAYRQMISTLLATPPHLLDIVDPEEARRAELILRDILPVSLRSKGMLNDGHFAGSPASIALENIKSPTLVISVEDDLFGTAQTARTIAARMPSAQLVVYPTGGHIWLGHNADVVAEIGRFIA